MSYYKQCRDKKRYQEEPKPREGQEAYLCSYCGRWHLGRTEKKPIYDKPIIDGTPNPLYKGK